jgi:hypothetical protein
MLNRSTLVALCITIIYKQVGPNIFIYNHLHKKITEFHYGSRIIHTR